MTTTPEDAIREGFSRPATELRRTAEELWSPDIVYREDPRWPGAGVFRGRDAVVARFEEYQELLTVTETEVGEVDLSGERVFWTMCVRGQGVGSGAPMDHWWAYVGELRDGLLTEFTAYFDPDEARAAPASR